MKKLTRVKLINWHRFTNAMIELENSVLISGENGAGKSTLLDAIQFVVTCSANYFNKAAHENGKRKLTGYIRCKTGRENRPYERTGEISAHVALEFYEEKRQKYFIVGAAGEDSPVSDGWRAIGGGDVFSGKDPEIHFPISGRQRKENQDLVYHGKRRQANDQEPFRQAGR